MLKGTYNRGRNKGKSRTYTEAELQKILAVESEAAYKNGYANGENAPRPMEAISTQQAFDKADHNRKISGTILQLEKLAAEFDLKANIVRKFPKAIELQGFQHMF